MQSLKPPPKTQPVTQGLDAEGMSNAWYDWALNVARYQATGVSGTVTLAKITGGGVNGSLTFTNGLITNFVAPT